MLKAIIYLLPVQLLGVHAQGVFHNSSIIITILFSLECITVCDLSVHKCCGNDVSFYCHGTTLPREIVSYNIVAT